ncbi:mersacidin/lichenicidin family type 2 lantibiotic, partial [Chamaesiphon polymorphus]
SQENIIRSWKSLDFRNGLSAKERAFLPENPAGSIELTDAELKSATGAARNNPCSGACNLCVGH